MATDIARLSFDPARFYRGVVPQQGRVSLEAEQNEQRVIDCEERRKELLNIVGPAGTPDNGYAGLQLRQRLRAHDRRPARCTSAAGGSSSTRTSATRTSRLARPGQRTGRRPAASTSCCWLQDTDVTAVEDPALYEVALGGPDGAARTRLLQRILRLPARAACTCAEALPQDRKQLAAAGLDVRTRDDGAGVELRLLGLEGDPEPANPCEPSSTGGYLGAENQCIRVQITDVDRDGTFDFVWGYDDASFLYRVTADASANPVLTLDRTPVDDFHRPRAGQAVQALRSTAQLASTDGVVEGYVAALGGEVGVLGAPYDPDTKTVPFPAPLPASYTDPDENPQLYLRVWEELVAGADARQADQPHRHRHADHDHRRLDGGGAARGRLLVHRRAPCDADDRLPGPLSARAATAGRTTRVGLPARGGRGGKTRSSCVVADCRCRSRRSPTSTTTGCCTGRGRARGRRAGSRPSSTGPPAGRGWRPHRPRHHLLRARPLRAPAPLVLRRPHSTSTLRGCERRGATVAAAARTPSARACLLLLDVDNVGHHRLRVRPPAGAGPGRPRAGETGGVFSRPSCARSTGRPHRYVSSRSDRSTAPCSRSPTARSGSPSASGTPRSPTRDHAARRLRSRRLRRRAAWGTAAARNRFLHHPTVPVTAGRASLSLAGPATSTPRLRCRGAPRRSRSAPASCVRCSTTPRSSTTSSTASRSRLRSLPT